MTAARWPLVAGALALAACGGGAAPASDGGGDAPSRDAVDAPDAEAHDASTIDVGLVLDAAADAGNSILPPWRSGATLRAVTLKVTGTPDAIFQGIHDARLGTSCRFARASDGVMRCMPGQSADVFSDAACKVPVATALAGCAAPSHVSRVEACRATGYQVGAKLAGAKLYTKVQQGCLMLEASDDVYALTALPASAFVAGAERREDRGGDLSMRYWETEDGGLFPIGTWDTERDASCVPGFDDYEDRCVPGATAFIAPSAAVFTDVTCTSPAGGRVEACDDDPVSAVTSVRQGMCGATVAFSGAAKLAGPPNRLTGGACAPWTDAPADLAFYTPEAPIESFALPTMTLVLEGVGRLKARRYMTAMDVLVDTPTMFQDTLLHVRCFPRPTTLGLRCAPENTVEATYFADPACKTPVLAEIKRGLAPGCDVDQPRVVAVSGTTFDACSGVVTNQQLFEVGAAITPAKLYRADKGPGCVEATANDVATLNVFESKPATDTTTAALEIVVE